MFKLQFLTEVNYLLPLYKPFRIREQPMSIDSILLSNLRYFKLMKMARNRLLLIMFPSVKYRTIEIE